MIPRTLDRYVLKSWVRIFIITALGFPLVSILINLIDFLDKWLAIGLSAKQIAISYFYSIPENVFIVMPASVLFATVFTVGNLNRHSEITAAKAGGQSFYRLMLPVFLAALCATGLAVVVGELAPGSSARMHAIQNPDEQRSAVQRFNFVYRAEAGWIYTVGVLDRNKRLMRNLVLERQGGSPEYPNLAVMADSALWDSTGGTWTLYSGASRFIADADHEYTVRFKRMQLPVLSQSPGELLIEPKAPDEMRYAELGRYIDALRRSGNDANKLIVEQALKLALPATCLIIALFGAPMAVSSPRAGTALGIAISLATTVIYLMMIQITKAVGASGFYPTLSAWIPNIFFLLTALVLLRKVQT